MSWDNVYRLGCESCGSKYGCVCDRLRSCTRCERDYLPAADDEGICSTCTHEDEVAALARRDPATACENLLDAVRRGRCKARPVLRAKFVNLTRKKRAERDAKVDRLVHLIVWGNYGV